MRGKVTIMHLVLSLDVGGLENLVIDLARNINKDRYSAIICCLQDSRDSILYEKVKNYGLEIIILKKYHSFNIRDVFSLAKIIKAKKTIILHSHNVPAHIYGVSAAKIAGIPIIIHTQHGNEIPFRKFYGPFLRRILSLMTHVFVCVSENVRIVCSLAYGINKKRITTILNGIDISKFKLQKEHALIIGFPADKRICVIGRLAPEKSHIDILHTFPIILQYQPNANLLIIGEGSLRRKLKNETCNMGIDNNVIFLGNRSDIPKLLNTIDIYVLPSITEGISLTLLEAMAAGKPVVATNVGGNPEVVIDGETGILVPPKDPERMAEAIIKLLQNPELAKKMGEAGRKRVEEKFSLNRMVKEYESLYEECLDKKGRL